MSQHKSSAHSLNNESTPEYTLLGATLLLLALLYPILQIEHIGLLVWISVFWLMLIAAVRATNYSSSIKKFAYALGGVVVLVGISGLICYTVTGNTHSWGYIAINTLTLLFLVFTTISVIYGILTSTKIGINHLVGIGSAYVLIGIAFAYVYILLHSTGYQPLLYNQNASGTSLSYHVANYCYYSFSTLTTLGYGDLSPISLPARVLSCSEAIAGQLFLTIVIARLVGLHVMNASTRNANPIIETEE